MNFPLPYLLDDGIGASTNNLNVLQLHQANTFMQPFDSPLHRFNQREVMIRQTRGSHQSRKTTTTADVGNFFEANTIRRIPNVRHNRSGIQNMPFPNDIDVTGADQSTRFTLFGNLGMETLQLRQRITQDLSKYR